MFVADTALLDSLSAQAAASARRRVNHNLHPGPDDPVQRFLNALEPGSYVRPHHHRAGVWELFCVLRGRLRVVVFEDDGILRRVAELAAGEAVELPEGVIHAIAALEPGTVALEVKPGPYVPAGDKDFAVWAPAEGDAAAAAFQRWLARAEVGERPPIPPVPPAA